MENADVVIIGAGVAGLIAAIELERAGVHPVILEASDVPGGRLKTDLIDGYLMDHGFQVLLTAYREAQHYLDYASLGLKNFDPGATIYTGEKTYELSDPLRQPGQLIPMLFSGVGSLSDKLKVAQLARTLKKQNPAELFARQEGVSTFEYLKQEGFSDKFINHFFRPFFSGIFLESDLSTSSSMFRFVFKMFAEGNAALPEGGIQAIPKQLIRMLSHTEIRFNEKVTRLGTGSVFTSGGEIKAGDILIATTPHDLLPGLKEQRQPFHNVLNLYFSTEERVIRPPQIGLSARSSSLINNFCYPSAVHSSHAPPGKELLSVSVVDVPDQHLDEIVELVKKEWKELTGQSYGSIEFLRAYSIPNALPVMDHLAFSMQSTAAKVQDHIFLAGDYLLYGSLNAAMTSGRTGAQALLTNRR